MARGSYKETNDPEFRITNKNLRLKREIINISKSKGMTYSQYCRSLIIKARNDASQQERDYDGC